MFFLFHGSVFLFSYNFLTVDKLCGGCTPGPTENWGLLVKIASHTSFQLHKEKIYLYLVAEKIDELVMRKIPQIGQAESAKNIFENSVAVLKGGVGALYEPYPLTNVCGGWEGVTF
jgi:hypothetical protein